MDKTSIRVLVTAEGEALPVEGAIVRAENYLTGEVQTAITDEDGQTGIFAASAPPKERSLVPGAGQPWASYDITVTAEGYVPYIAEGVQVYEGIESILEVPLQPARGRMGTDIVEIPPPAVSQPLPHSMNTDFSAERILRDVYIPDRIRVHLGSPNNSSARNVSVSFPDYIKNVASSEIYPTWPEASLRANILAEIGIALNRLYTEWYPSRGYNFDITNSTAYDQYYVHGRNIFSNISDIVDEIFDRYVRKQGNVEPYYTEYCNGSTVTCPGLSQWGTVTLANRGYTPIEILRYYYGRDTELARAGSIRSAEGSYPGVLLRRGSTGDYVAEIQNELRRIRINYPGIPAITDATGTFGASTEAAVRKFQSIFGLAVDGIVGKATWYKLSYIYTAVKNLAELGSEGELPSGGVPYPGYLIRRGSRGEHVRIMQTYLRELSGIYSDIPRIAADGVFGSATESAVRAFQRRFSLAVDGIVGPATWNKLAEVWGWYY